MSGFLYEVQGFIERNLKLKSLIAVTVFACSGLQASHAAAADCYADSVSALQTCLNNAEADEGNWHEIQLKEKTYYLTSPLKLKKGKVRLVGAGRVLDSPYAIRAGLSYSADIERTSDRKALNRAKFFVLDGQNQTRIFEAVDEGDDIGAKSLILYIQGLTFKNGNPTTDNKGGGGLLYEGLKLIIEHSIFTGNSDSALVHDAADQQSISDSYFYNNTAEYSTSNACPPSGTPEPEYWGGAITAHGSDYEIKRSTFENNRGCRGGAIWTAAEMTLGASTVSNNTADLGGGVYIADGSNGAAGMFNSTIYDNHASVRGGGLYFEQQQQTEWTFNENILAGNSASEGAFSDCYLVERPPLGNFYLQTDRDNILGNIGEGLPKGDCTFWLNQDSNQPTGVLDPELEELAYNGSIGLQLKTHLPNASSISLDVVSDYNGTCVDQRTRNNTIASSPQNKCAAGATQRIQQVNGTLGAGETSWVYSNHYKMVLNESQNIRIDLASDEADALLILKDANNNEIESNDDYDSSSSSHARITRQLNAGVYYISAKHDTNSGHDQYLRDYFLSVNAEVELTPSLVFVDNAEIAGRPTLGQTGSVLWRRTNFLPPPNTGGYWYKMDSRALGDFAIFESDFFDPADATLYFKYFLNGAYSGSLYLDIELDGVWHYDYWLRRSSNSNDISPDWQKASYDFNWLASQGYDKIRIRLFGWQDQHPYSSHSLLLDKIEISRYATWFY